MSPPAHQLAEYFSSRLSEPNDAAPIPTLEDCHQSLLTQFRIKVPNMRHILHSLDTTKSVGDDNVSPRVLKSCASVFCGPLTALFRKICLCGPLTALFRKICNTAIFPSSWKISIITPVYKKGTRPIAVLPTLSRVFEQLLITQLQCHISLSFLLSS